MTWLHLVTVAELETMEFKRLALYFFPRHPWKKLDILERDHGCHHPHYTAGCNLLREMGSRRGLATDSGVT